MLISYEVLVKNMKKLIRFDEIYVLRNIGQYTALPIVLSDGACAQDPDLHKNLEFGRFRVAIHIHS